MIKYSDKYIAQSKFNNVIKLETYFAEEQRYIWKNMIKIEKIKKEHLGRKNLLLRKTLRDN